MPKQRRHQPGQQLPDKERHAGQSASHRKEQPKRARKTLVSTHSLTPSFHLQDDPTPSLPFFTQNYNYPDEELYYNPPSGMTYSVPLALLRENLSVLQATSLYLHEHYGLTFSAIARLLSRDQRTIWTSYHQARNARKTLAPAVHDPSVQERLPGILETFPADILSRRSLSALEAVVLYLLGKRLNTKTIGKLLGRSCQTIYTIRRKLRAKGVSA
ncbi:hypothetical protein D6783_06090 [Candidatus Woesearchaeota archaeon]|nr:MAG: hypothetical protein D6783_06090 [Candidatus Woesearchaeota archaeon]